MRSPKLSPQMHWVLLILFVVGASCLIMLPILLMGYPFDVSGSLKYGQVFVDTGRIVDAREPLLPLILAFFHPFIAWNNVNAWVAVSVGWFCAAMLPLWWCVRMLFDRKTAWFSVAVFALLPLSWLNAYSIGGFSFVFLPFFLCCGIFIRFHAKQPLLTCIVCGLFFGMTLGVQHSFLAFMPWFALGYLWQERKHLLRSMVRVGLFCIAAYVMFASPYIPDALKPGLSPVERIMVFSPLAKQAKPGEGHLYPDEFLYGHYKKEYDAEMEKNVPTRSFLKNQEDLNYRIIFGAGHFTIVDRMISGTWLLLNNIPQFFTMDFVGGSFLWLFILPGIAIMWRTHRMLTLYIGGLIFTMEILLRFVLLFTSSHIDNYEWALAMFAGIGIATIIGTLAHAWKLSARKSALLTVFVMCMIGLQLLQATRKDLARLYARSRTPQVFAATEAFKSIPPDAVVANPRRDDFFIFSPQKYVSVHPVTIEFLSKRGKLAEPFDFYRVQYIIGYTKEQERMIKKAAPYVKVVELPETPPVPPLSTFVRYLLNTIR